MQNSVPALLRLTARPRYWRIAVILPGRILWRTYSREEYPRPDDAVRRCLAGLLFPDVSMTALKPGVHTPPSPDEEESGDDKHYDADKTQGAITNEYPRSDFKKLIHDLLLSCAVQPQTGQRAEESHDGYTEPQHRLPAVEDDDATQHPRLLRCARVRAAWWGWL